MMFDYKIIDQYSYITEKGKIKNKYYLEKKFSEEEIEKTNLLQKGFLDFEQKVRGNDELLGDCIQWIKYYNGKGYLWWVNADRSLVDIYYFGKEYEEALLTGLIEYEFCINYHRELMNRKKLNLQFVERFPEIEEDYHGPFFFAEFALQDFRKYYGDNIPYYLVRYYEDYLETIKGKNYPNRYDFYENKLVLQKNLTRHFEL